MLAKLKPIIYADAVRVALRPGRFVRSSRSRTATGPHLDALEAAQQLPERGGPRGAAGALGLLLPLLRVAPVVRKQLLALRRTDGLH